MYCPNCDYRQPEDFPKEICPRCGVEKRLCPPYPAEERNCCICCGREMFNDYEGEWKCEDCCN